MQDQKTSLGLRWRHTWPDREDDFAAAVDGYGGPVGRIYKERKPGALEDHRFWAMNAHGPEISRNIGALFRLRAVAQARRAPGRGGLVRRDQGQQPGRSLGSR